MGGGGEGRRGVGGEREEWGCGASERRFLSVRAHVVARSVFPRCVGSGEGGRGRFLRPWTGKCSRAEEGERRSHGLAGGELAMRHCQT